MVKQASQLYLYFLLATIFIFKTTSANATLTPGINRVTGQFIYTDLWGKSPIVEIDLKEKANRLGTTFQLGLDGKSVETWLILGIIGAETNDFPRDFSGNFSVQAQENTNDASRVLGKFQSSIILDPNLKKSAPATALLLSREDLGQGEALYIYKVHFNIPMSEKVTDSNLPYISIWAGINNTLWHWYYTPELASNGELKSERRNTVVGLTNQFVIQVATNRITSVARIQLTETNLITVTPEVQLSITRTNSFLLITFSPPVENAALEEANPNYFPWAWQPAVTEANQPTNGWFVSPVEPSRIYRVKVNP